MAQYYKLLGRRIEVQYRAGDIFLPATGILVADSGKSIFLEERFERQGQVKSFRWEIPYPFIMRLQENLAPPENPRDGVKREAGEALPEAHAAPLKHRPEEV
ncbi:MAG: hypothetical protein ACLP1Y_16535 [Candidatus Acidiferrales bacterium]